MAKPVVYCSLFLFLMLWTLNPRPSHADRTIDNTRLDRLLRKLMTCSGMEALSVSLVKDGNKEYERGYEDPRMQARPQRQHINEDTVFCLGGSTQAFTAVLLAKLLSEHENFTMDTPVHEITGSHYHLPGQFRTRRLNLKDILGMRTGLSNMDMVATAYGMTRYRLQQNLRYAPEVRRFREAAVYSEVLFSVAEDVARALGGDSWERLMRQHLFVPLGMSSASFIHLDAENSSKLAQPYVMFRDQHHVVPWEAFKGQELVAAATSVCVSARDMTKWMQFIVNNGKVPGPKQLVREEVIKSTFQAVLERPRTPDGDPRLSGFSQSSSSFAASYNRESNALGWIKGHYRGNTFISQDGSLPGYESLTTLIPSRKMGVFTAFTGVAAGKAYAAEVIINNYALDLMMGAVPWLTENNVCDELTKMAKETDTAEQKAISHHPRPGYAGPDAALIRPLEEYQGKYRNHAFGDVEVTYNETEDTLMLHYGRFAHYLMHASVQNDTFILQATNGPLWYSTHADGYHNGPHLAIFSNPHNDPSLRVETVTIPFFARDMDPVFSNNPGQPPEGDNYDCDCSGTGATTAAAAAAGTTTLLVATLMVHVLC